jgi:hypothetical protein
MTGGWIPIETKKRGRMSAAAVYKSPEDMSDLDFDATAPQNRRRAFLKYRHDMHPREVRRPHTLHLPCTL